MTTGLIELSSDEGGVLIEAEVEEGERRQVSGAATRVSESLDQIAPILRAVCKPIANTWSELNRDVTVESAEVQFGLSFEASGNVFIANGKGGANLTVKLNLKPKA